MMAEDEVLVLSSIWHRNRLIIHSRNIKEANKLFFSLKYFIPQYRQLILCGDIPKKAKFLTGVKLIESEDLDSLKKAFQQSFKEEELGTPPVQIVYFNAQEEVFRNVFSHLDRSWMVTCTGYTASLVKDMFKISNEIHLDGSVIYMLDLIEHDISIEEKLIEDTKNSSRGIKQFMIQMKQSQVHLAFQAIQDELESGKKITQSYLSETLGIRERTLRKIVDIGIRERRLDISNYIEEAPPEMVKFLREISLVREVSLAAVFEGENLIAYARYHDIGFPTLNFLHLKDIIENSIVTKMNVGKNWHIRLNTKNKDIFIYKHKYLYCFIMEKGINFIAFRSKVEKSVKNI